MKNERLKMKKWKIKIIKWEDVRWIISVWSYLGVKSSKKSLELVENKIVLVGIHINFASGKNKEQNHKILQKWKSYLPS